MSLSRVEVNTGTFLNSPVLLQGQGHSDNRNLPSESTKSQAHTVASDEVGNVDICKWKYLTYEYYLSLAYLNIIFLLVVRPSFHTKCCGHIMLTQDISVTIMAKICDSLATIYF